MRNIFKKFSVPFTALVTVLILILAAGCGGMYREEVRPVRTYSKNFFVHVVRYNGETLSLISLWYTGSEKNASEIRRQNRYISTVSEELVVNSRIMIPRRMLQTMKLMPVGFVRKNSSELGYEEDTPAPRPIATAIPSLTPTDTPTPAPTATATNIPTDTPVPEPTASPVPPRRPTTPVITRPRAERRDFSDEDPSESPNTQIQIPQDIVDELKNLGNVPRPQQQPQRMEPLEPQQEFIPPPTFDEEATAIPAPPPLRPRQMERPPVPEASAEPEPEISDDRKKLLEMLRGNGSR